MNLIEAQEQIKGLPTQALMQYAQGMNPQVPPYLALAEMSRRTQMQQQYAGQQAQAQGKPPTVAQQVQQQAAPMMPPQGGQPMEQGVASLPTPADMYTERGFARGGIVAFDDGGLAEQIPGYDGRVPEKEPPTDAERFAEWLRENQKKMGASREGMPLARGIKALLEMMQGSGKVPAAGPDVDVNTPQQQVQPPVTGSPWAGRTGPNPTTSLPLPKTPPAQRTNAGGAGSAAANSGKNATTAPAGLEGLEGDAITVLKNFFGSKPVSPEDPEETRKRFPQLQQPYGAESMRRLDAIEKARAKAQADRPMQELLALGRSFATAPSRKFGIAAAKASGDYAQLRGANAAADEAFLMKQNQLRAELEKADRAEAMGRYDDAVKYRANAAKLENELVEAKGRVAASVAQTVEQGRSRKEIAALNAAARLQAKAMGGSGKLPLDARMQEKIALALSRDPQVAVIKKKMELASQLNDTASMEQAQADYERLYNAVAARFTGGAAAPTMPAATSAVPPGQKVVKFTDIVK